MSPCLSVPKGPSAPHIPPIFPTGVAPRHQLRDQLRPNPPGTKSTWQVSGSGPAGLSEPWHGSCPGYSELLRLGTAVPRCPSQGRCPGKAGIPASTKGNPLLPVGLVFLPAPWNPGQVTACVGGSCGWRAEWEEMWPSRLSPGLAAVVSLVSLRRDGHYQPYGSFYFLNRAARRHSPCGPTPCEYLTAAWRQLPQDFSLLFLTGAGPDVGPIHKVHGPGVEGHVGACACVWMSGRGLGAAKGLTDRLP